MRKQNESASKHQDHDTAARGNALHAARTPGAPLPSAVREEMESRFSHDFSKVRVHTDAGADDATRSLAAHAFTIGNDVVFEQGRYAPSSPAGLRMLAHELAHVVQQSDAGVTSPDANDVRVTDTNDASEQAAHAAADSAVSGRPAEGLAGHAPSVPSGGSVVQRWPWDDDSASSGGGGGGSLWDSVSGAASSAVDFAGSAASAVSSAYNSATDFKGAAASVSDGMDWLGNKSDEGNQKMVDDAKGIPVLEQLAEGSAWFNGITGQVTTGAVKGVADVVGGVAHGMAHPIDAAGGMLGLLEHDSPVPFLGSMLKGGHGLYDLAVNGGGQYGNSMGDLANHVFNPLQQQKDDADYNMSLVTGILAPGDEDKGGGWQAWSDRPVEAGVRALTNVLPFLLGGEAEAGLAGEAKGGSLAPKGTVPVPELPPPSVPPPTSRGMPTIPGVGPGRTPTLIPPEFIPIEPAPPTSRGMPTIPGGEIPGRYPTLVPDAPLPGVEPIPGGGTMPFERPIAPPSSGRPVPSSFPEVPSFPSEPFPPESPPPSGRPTGQANPGHRVDLSREQQLAEHNRRIERQGGGQFPPAPDLGDWRRWLPWDSVPPSSR